MAGLSISPGQERSLNFFGFSPGELLLIMMLAMIVLGPEKLPEVAGSIGKWVAEFRRATQELTQQFGDENPFTEIQRALNLTNEPIVLGKMPTQAIAEEAPPVQTAAPVFAPPAGYEPAVVTSDYFSRPPLHTPIADDWAHGSVPEEWGSRLNGNTVFTASPVADDWAHGVPVPRDPLLETILATHAELEQAAQAQPDGMEVAAAEMAPPETEDLTSTHELAGAVGAGDHLEEELAANETESLNDATVVRFAPDHPDDDRGSEPSQAESSPDGPNPTPSDGSRVSALNGSAGHGAGVESEPIVIGARDERSVNGGGPRT